MGDRSRAVQILAEAAQRLPEDPLVRLELGVVQSQVQLWRDAISNLEAATKYLPKLSGEAVLTVRGTAAIHLAKCYDSLYKQAGSRGESNALSLCLKAQYNYEEFLLRIGPQHSTLGEFVSEARARLDELKASACGT
jgi:uncharacterized protein HemY